MEEDSLAAPDNPPAPPLKKPRGNPNLKKGQRNLYYPKDEQHQNKMADETTTPPTEQTAADPTGAETASTPTPPPTDPPKTAPIDIFSEEIQNSELPLDGEVKQQTYGQLSDTPPGNSNGGGNNTPPIPPGTNNEPPLGQPNPNASSAPMGGQAQQLTPEEIKTNAEQTVRLMLRGYEKLHSLGRWAGKQNMEALVADHNTGKINLNKSLPLGKKSITLGGFFEEYNASIDENIVVTEEFKKDITPPLIRICVKRGWVMNDEMAVLLLLGEDMATKASMLIGLKATANLVLESCREMQKKEHAGEPPAEPIQRADKKEKEKERDIEDVAFTTVSPEDEWKEDSK